MTFEIYFSDLNKDAQTRLLNLLNMENPEEGNYDTDLIPLAIIDFEVDV